MSVNKKVNNLQETPLQWHAPACILGITVTGLSPFLGEIPKTNEIEGIRM